MGGYSYISSRKRESDFGKLNIPCQKQVSALYQGNI